MKFDTRLRDHIKATVSMREAIDLIGWEQPNRNNKIHSIYNQQEHTPSLHVYDEHYYCYAAGQGGDVIKFVMDAMNVSFGRAMDILGRGIQFSPRQFKRKREETFKDLGKIFKEQPVPDERARQMANELINNKWPTLTLDDILSYGVRLTPTSLWAPHTDEEGIIRGIKIRTIPTGSKYSVDGSNYSKRLYRVRETHPMAETLFICEGESDLWCIQKWIDQNDAGGSNVLSLPSGAGMWREEWAREVESSPHIVLLLDNDDAGNKACERIKDGLGPNFVQRLDIPEGRVAEAMALGWEPLC